MGTGSNTFGGTIKLEGEKEYRSAISDINSSLKVMGSEMTKVTAEYGKNDKSTEGLTAKNKILSDQIEKQKEKVANLKGALNDSSEKYGENDKKTQSWKISLNKAEAELIGMEKDLKNNNEAMKDGSKTTDDSSKSVKKFGEETEDAGKKTLSLGDIIKANLISEAIIGGVKALASGVASVAGKMGEALSNGSAYADNILTLSTQTGVSTEALQKYSAVAELVDVSTETMTGSMAKNIKSMSAGKDAYGQLGVAVKDSNGNLRDSETVYWESIDALGKIEDTTQRDALAMEIFGKSAQDLNPLIAQGSAGIKDLGDEAVRMGAVLSEDGLKALGDLDDQMQIFKTTTGATGNILASAFAPACTAMLEGVNDLGAGFNYLISSVLSGDEGGIEEATQMFSDSITSLVDNVTTFIPDIISIGQNLISSIISVVVDNLPIILQGGIDLLTSLLNGIVSALPQILPVVIQALMTIVQAIIQNLPTILQAGITVLVELIKGIAQALPQLIPAIVDAVVLMVTTLIDNIDLIIDAGIEIILGLIDGLILALPKLIDKIPEIIDKLINAIVNNLPKIIEAGITLIIKLAEGLIKAIPQLVSKIPQIIASIVSGIANGLGKMLEMGGQLLGKVKDGIVNGIGSLLDVGKNLVQGLWNGINNAKDWVLDKIKGFGQSILNGIKSFFGIHSPSTLFRDEVGKNLALGVGEGFSDEMDAVTTDMQNSLPTSFDMGVNGNLQNNITTSTNIDSANVFGMNLEVLKTAFKEALQEFMGVINLNDEKVGKFVIEKVEEVVYN